LRQAFQHALEDVIFGDAQVVVSDFDRNVPVAEVVGNPGETFAFPASTLKSFSCEETISITRPSEAVTSRRRAGSRRAAAPRDLLARGERRLEPAFLARLERQLQRPFTSTL